MKPVHVPAITLTLACALLAGCGSSPATSTSATTASATPIATVYVNPSATTTPIAPSFLGFSMVVDETSNMIGSATTVNPIFLQLYKNLATYQNAPMVIRELSDEPVNSNTATNLAALSNFYNTVSTSPSVGVKYYVGVDFADNFDTSGNDTGLAASEAATIVTSLPTGSLLSFEIGNEPDLYPGLTTPKRTASTWNYALYKSQYEKVVADIAAKNTGIPVNGPTFSGVNNSFIQSLPDFINSESSHLGILDLHYYGGSHCTGNVVATDYLMTDGPVDYATDASQPNNQYANVALLKATGHSNIRIGEMNSVSCQGQSGVSDTFQSALWFLDTSMGFAQAGVSGINLFTISDPSFYSPFQFNRTGTAPNYTYTISKINPVYYAMIAEAQLLQKNAALLPIVIGTNNHIKAYATKDSGGTLRVLLLNKEEILDGTVALNLAGHGNATTLALQATNNNFLASDYSSITANDQITLGGQTFKGSADGKIQGTLATPSLTPANGVYTVTIPHASAVLVTIP